MDFEDKLIEQLDKDKPNWYIEWASQQQLQQLNHHMTDRVRYTASLKRSLIRSIAHPILHAAFGAGLIKE